MSNTTRYIKSCPISMTTLQIGRNSRKRKRDEDKSYREFV